jgi:hypothetical protein
MQRLQHEPVAAQRHDHIRRSRLDLAIGGRQRLKRSYRRRSLRSREPDPLSLHALAIPLPAASLGRPSRQTQPLHSAPPIVSLAPRPFPDLTLHFAPVAYPVA